MNNWINKDTEIYCSFAKEAGNTGCQMMNSAFYYYGLNKIYKSFSVDNMKDAISAVKTLDIKGFAITMPFKVVALNYIDVISTEVQTVGAVNTVLNDNGILTAFNTDYLAAKTILNDCLNKRLYILGNGGYSRAVQAAAKDLGIDFVIINRKNWSNISKITNSIVYNCTPVPDIKVNDSNKFIDCIATTKTGHHLAIIQASHQFKLYTGLEFPLGQ